MSPQTILTALFVTLLLTSNVVAGKLFQIGGLILPAAVVLFPLTYVLNDLAAEWYGYRGARQLVLVGFACNLVMVAGFLGTLALPAAEGWMGQVHYEAVLGATPRLLMASLTAYLAGGLVNARVFVWIRARTRGRWFALRAIGSTLVGQALDTALFITLAFAGTLDAATLLRLMLAQWLTKCALETLVCPLTAHIARFCARTRLAPHGGGDRLGNEGTMCP